MTAVTETLKNGAAGTTDKAGLPPRPPVPIFQFERQDWTLFRSVATLSQKAGVPANRLRRLVLKELTDNSLDAGGAVQVGRTDDSYFVQDDGPGLDGTPEDIARKFSINRPMVSSKLWRLPTRGALGNGLRVVAGAVLSSGGTLHVWTRNQHLVLTPQDDGTTAVIAAPADFAIGTRVEITFGDALPADDAALVWAETALVMGRGGEAYGGRTSPHWYDNAAFYELVQGAGDRSVRDLVANLDGCTGATAGRVAAAFKGRSCRSLSRDETASLLRTAKATAKVVTAKRLGQVGSDAMPSWSYAKSDGVIGMGRGDDRYEVPVVAETWVRASKGEGAAAAFFVNKTPITGEVSVWLSKNSLALYNCGFNNEAVVSKACFTISVNLITPYMPITSDGKEPDFSSRKHNGRSGTTKAYPVNSGKKNMVV